MSEAASGLFMDYQLYAAAAQCISSIILRVGLFSLHHALAQSLAHSLNHSLTHSLAHLLSF